MDTAKQQFNILSVFNLFLEGLGELLKQLRISF